LGKKEETIEKWRGVPRAIHKEVAIMWFGWQKCHAGVFKKQLRPDKSKTHWLLWGEWMGSRAANEKKDIFHTP